MPGNAGGSTGISYLKGLPAGGALNLAHAAKLCLIGLCFIGGRGSHSAPLAFRADSARIAFASHRDGNWEIYVTDGDGRNQIRLTKRGGHTRFPLWSPDRSKIAFGAQRGGAGEGWDFWVMNADGTN